MSYRIRDFRPGDAPAVNTVALAAFGQYAGDYTDWPTFAANVGRTAALAGQGELIVAELDGEVVGAVTYIGPHRPKSDFFELAWPIIRLLVVAPSARGHGIGRALTEACVARARRDGALEIALHTSPIMVAALRMYRDMGFVQLRTAPPVHGVPCDIYLMPL